MFGKLKRGHDHKNTNSNLATAAKSATAAPSSSSTPPVGTDHLFLEISRDPRQLQIIAIATGHDASNWESVSASDLKRLLAKPAKGQPDYRTPAGFAKFRDAFLDSIRPQATSDQLQAYVDSFDVLEQNLYGNRFTTFEETDPLPRSPKAPETPTNPIDLSSKDLDAIISEETSKPPVSQQSSSSTARPALASPLSPLTPDRSNEILSQTTISGDPWRQDGTEYPLTIANLINNALAPMSETTLDGQTIFFSAPFQLSDGRGAILGYLPANNGNAANGTASGYKLRSYYLNPKTGLWYFAPDVIRGPRAEGMSQPTDGYSPASITLPIALQQQLSTLIKSTGFQEITSVNPDFLFAGAASAYDTLQDYREALDHNRLHSDFYTEVDHDPILRNWQPTGRNKNAPQLISVNADLAPDFSSPLASFNSYSSLAGNIVLTVYPSHDGQYLWIFGSDDWGRSWLAQLEAISPLTSTGCRRNWADAGDLATPLYENTTKSANFGDPSDPRKGLVGMWNHYLSKIPLIQEYVAARNK